MNEPTDIDFFRRTGFMYEVEGRSNSEFHGDGLFTKEDIPKGSVVFYWGLAEGDTHISEETYLEKLEACDSNRILDMNFSQYIAPYPFVKSYSVDSPDDISVVEQHMIKDKYWGKY